MAKNLSNLSGMGKNANTSTPQTQKAREDQVLNSAGGYVFATSDWERLTRFLVLGSEGGTYYVSEKKLTRDNANNIVKLIKSDYKRVVDTVVKISDEGRAPKNDPALFVLALVASSEDAEARKYALQNLNKVARIGTHLFTFVQYCVG